jgi:superfamily I DNA/RNA helicase
MEWLDALNIEQRGAATAPDGPALIMAGPGTGKTKTLTSRIAYLLASGAAQPAHIVALTFTKKAAQEMRERAVALTPAAAETTIATFHALCFEILGGEPAFISDIQRLHIIKSLAKPAALKGVTTRELGLLISRSKNMADDNPHVAALATAYDVALAAQGLIDFDDLLVRTHRLLAGDPTVRAQLQDRYRYILVDEFQDTNRLQYELLALLRGTDNLFVIGDPNQSIYGFRGASGSIFKQFMQDFPAHTAITLTVNYRSAPEIVQVANNIFATDTLLTAQGAVTGRVRAVQVLNEYSEANWILQEINAAIGGADMNSAVSNDDRGSHRTLRDFAVIYRSRSAAGAVQKAIEASGLPYQVVGEGSPYEQPQVQTIIALLRSTVSMQDTVMDNFSAPEITAIHELLSRSDAAAPSKLVERLADILGFDMSPSIQQFIATLVRFKNVAAAIAYIDRVSETGFYDPDADAVTLLTIHASKGLEFPYVFVVGAEEGLLPYARADEDEERRLFYVAATRAREVLDITYTLSRAAKPAAASRFVLALDSHVLPRVLDPMLAADKQRAKKRAAKRSQQSLF